MLNLPSHYPKFAERRAHSLGNVAGGEMRVLTLRHPRVLMAELRSDNAHWYALHREPARIGVPENMEGDCRVDLGRGTRLSHRPKLMRSLPRTTVGASKDESVAGLLSNYAFEEAATLVGQGDVP